MYKQKIFWLLVLLLIAQPAWSRHKGKLSGNYGQPVKNHGQFVQRSYKSLMESKQADIVRTQAIAQYMKIGCQLEVKKKWADAEQAFRYVLRVVALRDGPGSFESVPALEHLVKVSRAQNKLDEAISFQETAMLLKKAQPNPNQQAVLDAQISLEDLLLQKQDYLNAASVLKESIALYKSQPSLSQQKRQVTYERYVKALRQLHKDSIADAIQAEANAGSSAGVIIPRSADNPASPVQSAAKLKGITL